MRRAIPFTAPVLALLLAGCSAEPPGYHQGYIEGKFVHAAPALGGRLLQLPVREGRRVTQGELLFALDAAPEQAELAAAAARVAVARANYQDLNKGRRVEEVAVLRAARRETQAALELAEADLKRARELFEARMIPRSELDAAQSTEQRARAALDRTGAELGVAELAARSDQIEAARLELEAAAAEQQRAEWALQQKRVAAPAAGVIETVYHRQGEWVPAGSPVLSLLPDGARVVRYFVAEGELAAVQLGQLKQLRCDGCADGIRARVSYIAAEAEYTPPVIYSRRHREKLVFLVEAAIEGDGAALLHPGMPVEIFDDG